MDAGTGGAGGTCPHFFNASYIPEQLLNRKDSIKSVYGLSPAYTQDMFQDYPILIIDA